MKAFAFSKQGLEQAKQYKDYKGMTAEFIEDHPELFPIITCIAVITAAIILSPGASIVAYKTALYDSAQIAFKLGGM